ncbi:MAG: hypothetical protein RLZZ142_343 [Verrucomicrobiota bacterium]|jgi:glucose-6-phosphate dehydrogenase assembly protein OpcA
MPFDPAILGFPVGLDQIARQLKALWETEGEAKTRASLVNFAVYTQGTETLEEYTRLIAQFVREHSCRAILVGDCPQQPGPKISAWIQAHCHLNKAGAKQVCSEQITLLAEGVSEEGIANALMSNLDYDLPLVLWWQAQLPPAPSSPLWSRVDRLLFDSASWTDPAEQLHRLHLLKAFSETRMALSDLNWTRSLPLRQAAAQCFDTPELLASLPSINHLQITHGKGLHLSALLVACWFGAQIGWHVIAHDKPSIHFRSPTGQTIHCDLRESPEPAPFFASLHIHTPTTSLALEREDDASLFRARLTLPSGPRELHFSAGSETFKGLLVQEMTPGERHRVYRKTLALAQTLF